VNDILMTKLITELLIMKDYDIKPNISDLSRKYGVSRATIKKYIESNGIPKRKAAERSSKWDRFADEITEIFDKGHITKRAAYNFLANKYGDEIPGTYNGFKAYTLRKGLIIRKSEKPHPWYETEPGKQLQADWKESISLHLKNGDEIVFNVLSATLGYSREHVFIFSFGKTTEDYIRCMIEVFRRLGGVTEEVLTDNMSAVVTIKSGKKHRIPKVTQFFKDIGVVLKLAKVRTPQTKGKTENSNKFVNWIYAYDGELEAVDDVIYVIENTITSQANRQINSRTGMPPAALFREEKKYLRPLAHKVLLDTYVEDCFTSTIDPDLLVYYKGSRYSVPPECIGHRVKAYPIDNRLYIYDGGNLAAIHNITQKPVNYDSNHYSKALKLTIGRNSDIDVDKMAEANLKLLDSIGKKPE